MICRGGADSSVRPSLNSFHHYFLSSFPSAHDVDALRQGYCRLARGSAEVADERAGHIIYMYRFGTSEREVKHRAGRVDARLGKRGVGHGAFGNLLEL